MKAAYVNDLRGAKFSRLSYMYRMDDNAIYPYELEVQPSVRTPGAFDWAIRRHGKLIQRSDRLQRSEEAARKDGMKAVERQFLSAHSTR